MTNRIAVIDFLKGLFLVLMIVLHTIYTFIPNLIFAEWIIPILRTSTIGFPMMVGMLFAQKGLSRRNIFRGVFLISLFVFLNLIIGIFGQDTFKISDIIKILSIGNQDLTAFEILLPIGYLFILSPIITKLKDWKLIGAIIIFFLSIETLVGHSYNLIILVAGLIGYLIGGILEYIPKLNERGLIVGIFAISAISYSLFVQINWIADILLTVAIALAIIPIYGKNIRVGFIELLGKHTLPIYILQIIGFKVLSMIV